MYNLHLGFINVHGQNEKQKKKIKLTLSALPLTPLTFTSIAHLPHTRVSESSAGSTREYSRVQCNSSSLAGCIIIISRAFLPECVYLLGINSNAVHMEQICGKRTLDHLIGSSSVGLLIVLNGRAT